MKKGFTLLEILIASTIFAGAMIMTTAIVSQGGSYQSKLKLQRETSEETRKLADMITTDIRNASGSFLINGGGSVVSFKNGLGFFNCQYNNTFCNNVDEVYPGFSNANTIVLTENNKVKIYWFVADNAQAVYYYEFDRSELDASGKIDSKSLDQIVHQSSIIVHPSDPTVVASNHLIAGSADSALQKITPLMKTTVLLTSLYCPNASINKTKQPFVKMKITSELGVPTNAFGIEPSLPYEHAKTAIQTTVTSRSYDQ